MSNEKTGFLDVAPHLAGILAVREDAAKLKVGTTELSVAGLAEVAGDTDQMVIASGKTVTFSNTLTFAGTDATTMTFPSTDATIARTDAANTFTGNQTAAALFTTNLDAGASGTAGTVDVFPATEAKGKIAITATDSTGNTTTTITNAAQSATATMTIPDTNGSASFVMTAAAQTIGGVKTFSSAIATSANIGTPATGVTAAETGDGVYHRTVLTVATVLPAITGGAAEAEGVLLYTMPAGAIAIHSAKMSLAITQTQGNITADTPDGGLGSVIATGAVSTLDGTATFEDILTGQTFNDCNGTAEVKTVSNQPMVMETGAAHTVHFNAADTWAASGDAAATVTGTVTLVWSFIG